MLVAKGALDYDKTSADASNGAMDASAVQYRRSVAFQTIFIVLQHEEFIDLSRMK